MIDLRRTIIPKSDQINADDLIAGPLTIRITGVSVNDGEQPVAITFDGDGGKPYRPGKSMRRVLVNIWGPDGEAYIGRSLTLYRDEEVKFGGEAVGGIRISHMSHIEHPVTMALTATRKSRKPFTIQPLKTVDRVEAAVTALLERIAGAVDVAEVVNDPAVQKQRAWLETNRPQHAARITAAIEAATILREQAA